MQTGVVKVEFQACNIETVFVTRRKKIIILLTKRIIIVSRVFSVNHPQLNHRLFETRIKRIEGLEDLTDEAKYILIAVQPKKYTACCILLKQAKCFLTQDMSINLVCNVVQGIKMLRPRDDVITSWRKRITESLLWTCSKESIRLNESNFPSLISTEECSTLVSKRNQHTLNQMWVNV